MSSTSSSMPVQTGNSQREHSASLIRAVSKLDEIFETMDFDHNHCLDREEIQKAFTELNFPCSQAQMDSLFNGGDGRPGGLTKRQFALYCFHMEVHLKHQFEAIDEDGNGYITKDEFLKSFRLFGWKLSEQSAIELMDNLDTDRDGHLSYEEWRFLLASTPPEGKSWADVFVTTTIASEGILGDNLRPVRQQGESRYVDLIAGFAAGTVSRTLTAPAERIKTELQLQTKSESMLAVCRQIASSGGVRGFFQGNLANCIKVAPQSALFFALTDHFKRTLPTRVNPSQANLHSFLSGTMAGITSQFLIYPLEPMKTKLTVAPVGHYSGMVDCAREIFRESGIRGFYRGALPTLAGCIPYAGVQRLTYDWMREEYTRRSTSETPSAAMGFAAGLVSSSLGMAVSYPLVLIRTRLQMQHSGPELQYEGVWDCFLKIVRIEGPRGLMKGFFPNLLKGAPAAAINFALYDYCKDSLKTVV